MTLRYDIDSSGKRPYSIITTRAADGLSTSDTSARESAAFVDGLGRVVVTLEQADPTAGDGGSYIAAGLTDYDQKGDPKRQFLPWFTNQSPSTFSSRRLRRARQGHGLRRLRSNDSDLRR